MKDVIFLTISLKHSRELTGRGYQATRATSLGISGLCTLHDEYNYLGINKKGFIYNVSQHQHTPVGELNHENLLDILFC